MIDTPEEAPALDYEQLPLFSAFISDQSGRRVASAFILRSDVGCDPWSRYFSHAYLVTALHAVLNKTTGEFRSGLTLEFPWMQEQGLSRLSLDRLNWSFLQPGELPFDETAIDLAIAPLRYSAFTGLQFGRSIRAVDQRICEYGSMSRFLGAETVSVGLFGPYNGNIERVEPILRFGRVTATPSGSISTHFGQTRAILVESSADAGTSGAPVFMSHRGYWSLLGVHVGHYTTAQVATADTGAVRFDAHASVGIVIPANRLDDDLVYADAILHARENVDAEIERYPWRFLDRRHREIRGVVLAEGYFENTADYIDSGESATCAYLLYRMPPSGGVDDPFTTPDQVLEWTTHDPEVLSDASTVASAVHAVLGAVEWSRREERLWRGSIKQADESYIKVDLFTDGTGDARAIYLSSSHPGLEETMVDSVARRLGGDGLRIVDLQSVEGVPSLVSEM